MNLLELKKLKARCILFNEYMITEGCLSFELIKITTDLNCRIIDAESAEDIRIIENLSTDIDFIIDVLPESMLRDLKNYFVDKLGQDLLQSPVSMVSGSGEINSFLLSVENQRKASNF